MRTTQLSLSSQTYTAPVPLDNKVPVSITVDFPTAGTLTYSVQYTVDDVFAKDYVAASGTWVNFPEATSLTAATTFLTSFPCKAVRLNVSSYSSGTVRISVSESFLYQETYTVDRLIDSLSSNTDLQEAVYDASVDGGFSDAAIAAAANAGNLVINVMDYGAKFDGVTDDTAAIQAAIDAAPDFATVQMPPGMTRISNLVLRAEICFAGAGRTATILKAVAGSTGKMITDEGNGAKIEVRDFSCYANDEAYSAILELGVNDIQFGTAGMIRNLFLRDAPSGYGLYVDGNVGYIENVETQGCNVNAKILGNGNLVRNLTSMQAVTTGLDLIGCQCSGLHIEATESGGLPLKMYGDVTITDLVISMSAGTFSHLIEVDTSVYLDWWSIRDIKVYGSVTPTNGCIKIGSSYYGGTSVSTFSNSSYLSTVKAYTANFEIKHQRLQAFTIRLYNNGGTIQHRIGSGALSSNAGNFHSKINAASATLQNTPTGTDTSTAFAYGLKISNPTTSLIILDVDAQTVADAICLGSIAYNSTTTALNMWTYVLSSNVNGVTKSRWGIQFTNATTGANYNLTTMPSGSIIEISLMAYIA